mgnify:FL=1
MNDFTYTLVAIDYIGNSDELALARALGDDAVILVTEYTTRHFRGHLPAYRFTIDNRVMRNTVAHGIGCDHGFVCHIDSEVSA